MTDLTIATVLEHYGADLSRVQSTGWRPVKCPFHDDRIASASVNNDIGVFVCHACNVSGGPLKLIRLMENLDARGAREFAERQFGTSVGRVRRAAKANNRREPRSVWDHTLFE